MKTAITLGFTLLICVLFSSSCRKNILVFSSATVTLNDTIWSATGRASVNGKLNFGLGTLSSEGFSRTSLGFVNIPCKKGKYVLSSLRTGSDAKKPFTTFALLGDDGCVTTASYDIDDDDPNNILEITDVCHAKRGYEGRFDLRFHKVAGNKNEPDTIVMKDGTFKITLE